MQFRHYSRIWWYTVCFIFFALPGSREKEPLGVQSIGNQRHRFSHEQAAKSFKGLIEGMDKVFKSYSAEKGFLVANNWKRCYQGPAEVVTNSLQWFNYVVKCVPPHISGEQNRDPIHELGHSATRRRYQPNQAKWTGRVQTVKLCYTWIICQTHLHASLEKTGAIISTNLYSKQIR